MATRSSRSNKQDNGEGSSSSSNSNQNSAEDIETDPGKSKTSKEAGKKRVQFDEEEEEDGVTPRKLSCASALSSPKGKSKINVGQNFQAALDSPPGPTDREVNEDNYEWVLWKAPAKPLETDEYNSFVTYAQAKGMTLDRALFILMKCDYNFDEARKQLDTRVLINEHWTLDDVVLFRQAYTIHGKNFKKIQLMLPHRSVASLVDHYYHTKKSFKQNSLLEKMGILLNDDEDDYITMLPWGKGTYDSISLDNLKQFVEKFQEGMCENCGHIVSSLLECEHKRVCYVCFIYYEKNNAMRPSDYIAALREEVITKGYTCPDDYDDLVGEFEELCCSNKSTSDSDNENVPMDSDVEVVFTKQSKTRKTMHDLHLYINRIIIRCHRTEYLLENMKSELPDLPKYKQIVKEYVPKKERTRVVPAWTDKERFFAFLALVRYELNFSAVAEIVGNKSPDMIRAFYIENQEKLDELVAQQKAIPPPKSIIEIEAEEAAIREAQKKKKEEEDRRRREAAVIEMVEEEQEEEEEDVQLPSVLGEDSAEDRASDELENSDEEPAIIVTID